MSHRFRAAVAALVLTTGPAALMTATVGEAHATGRYFSSCDALHRVFKYGVARSQTAAAKQVRAGYHRPSYGTRAKAVYTRNHSRLDRDQDGTACEA